MAFLDMFSSRAKVPIHIVQIILIHIAIGCSVPRLFMKNQPRTRANTIALGMGAKSLMFIAYIMLTEHVPMFKRWASKKANLILNALEPLFWGAVAFLVMQANLKNCNGVGCYLSWVVFGVAIPLNMLAVYQAVVSWKEWREYKAIRNSAGDSVSESDRSYLAATQTKYEPNYPMERVHHNERQEV